MFLARRISNALAYIIRNAVLFQSAIPSQIDTPGVHMACVAALRRHFAQQQGKALMPDSLFLLPPSLVGGFPFFFCLGRHPRANCYCLYITLGGADTQNTQSKKDRHVVLPCAYIISNIHRPVVLCSGLFLPGQCLLSVFPLCTMRGVFAQVMLLLLLQPPEGEIGLSLTCRKDNPPIFY